MAEAISSEVDPTKSASVAISRERQAGQMRTKFLPAEARPFWPGRTHRRTPCPLVLAGLALMLATAPAAAHHSFVMFDKHRTVQIEGAVKRFEWTNPHVYIEVTTDGPRGEKVVYKLESASINMLTRHGWRSNSMRIGDSISATFNPLKTRRPGGLLLDVTLANGTRLKG
ncbi:MULTISPECIES: DUF6152 family protein [unclassified Sphingobium]|uniref:DUF6152 family protein n=1 Tax=unclassified Sphingobium TaxID=2611147 RepID=UPI0011A3DDF2|nr:MULTISPECIES: DUF6152 family protein [unclassified Sphingobium]MBG6120531.1 hypothetical protein [Sphingobium sp. JAI105]